jgi:hypothetical protein
MTTACSDEPTHAADSFAVVVEWGTPLLEHPESIAPTRQTVTSHAAIRRVDEAHRAAP